MPSKAWPLFGLRVATPRLTLQLPHDTDLLTLAEQAAERVLPREQAGFMGAWTQLPSPEFERSFMRFHWGLRANWTPGRWSLELGIYPDGHDEPVGMIGAGASDFARLRSATTGSWLLPRMARPRARQGSARRRAAPSVRRTRRARSALRRAPGQRSVERRQPLAWLPLRRH